MKKIILLVLVFLGWATLVIRLYMRITTADFSALESTVQFFSYFTILTNLLVTLYFTNQLVSLAKNKSTIFDRAESLTALTVFILIVGLVYHIALKPIWNPAGFEMILSEIHHTVVPLGALVLWILSTNKRTLNLKKLMTWLAYPIIYISFVLFRGSFANFYPYPFLDVQTLGLGAVVVNSIGLLVIMITFLILFFYLGKIGKKPPLESHVNL